MPFFGQVWVWSLAGFLVGALLCWLLIAAPARRRVTALEGRLAAAPRPQERPEPAAERSPMYIEVPGGTAVADDRPLGAAPTDERPPAPAAEPVEEPADRAADWAEQPWSAQERGELSLSTPDEEKAEDDPVPASSEATQYISLSELSLPVEDERADDPDDDDDDRGTIFTQRTTRIPGEVIARIDAEGRDHALVDDLDDADDADEPTSMAGDLDLSAVDDLPHQRHQRDDEPTAYTPAVREPLDDRIADERLADDLATEDDADEPTRSAFAPAEDIAGRPFPDDARRRDQEFLASLGQDEPEPSRHALADDEDEPELPDPVELSTVEESVVLSDALGVPPRPAVPREPEPAQEQAPEPIEEQAPEPAAQEAPVERPGPLERTTFVPTVELLEDDHTDEPADDEPDDDIAEAASHPVDPAPSAPEPALPVRPERSADPEGRWTAYQPFDANVTTADPAAATRAQAPTQAPEPDERRVPPLAAPLPERTPSAVLPKRVPAKPQNRVPFGVRTGNQSETPAQRERALFEPVVSADDAPASTEQPSPPQRPRRSRALVQPASGVDTFVPPGPFGPGSAMPLPGGVAPSGEYTVKASVTALRYCSPESPKFDRTIAEVWFRTVADAERVGFRPLG